MSPGIQQKVLIVMSSSWKSIVIKLLFHPLIAFLSLRARVLDQKPFHRFSLLKFLFIFSPALRLINCNFKRIEGWEYVCPMTEISDNKYYQGRREWNSMYIGELSRLVCVGVIFFILSRWKVSRNLFGKIIYIGKDESSLPSYLSLDCPILS